MTSKSPARSAEDVDATALSYAEVKALATGDDRIREKMDLDVQVAKLKMLKANHTSMQYEMQDKALKYYPQQMAETKLFIEALGKDLPIVQAHPVKDDAFTMTVMGQTYTERKEAGEAIIKACLMINTPKQLFDLGEYRGFPMQLHFDGFKYKITLKQNLTYSAELADDPVGNVTRINNALEGMAEKIEQHEARLVRLESELKNAQEEAERPFPKEDELRQKSERLSGSAPEAINIPAASAPAPNTSDTPKLTKVSMVFSQERLEALKSAMNQIGVTGMTVTQVLGYGTQKGHDTYYRGVKLDSVKLLPKVKVEVVVSKVPVQDVIDAARKALYTGHVGDGKFFVYDVEQVVKVRTGELGYDALQGEE